MKILKLTHDDEAFSSDLKLPTSTLYQKTHSNGH